MEFDFGEMPTADEALAVMKGIRATHIAIHMSGFKSDHPVYSALASNLSDVLGGMIDAHGVETTIKALVSAAMSAIISFETQTGLSHAEVLSAVSALAADYISETN